MNKKDCKVGMKVCLTERLGRRSTERKIGTVVGIYSTYAVIRFKDKYNSAFFFNDIDFFNDNNKEDF